jgi:hypothetical protein
MMTSAARIREHRHERLHMRHPVAKAVVVVIGIVVVSFVSPRYFHVVVT